MAMFRSSGMSLGTTIGAASHTGLSGGCGVEAVEVLFEEEGLSSDSAIFGIDLCSWIGISLVGFVSDKSLLEGGEAGVRLLIDWLPLLE